VRRRSLYRNLALVCLVLAVSMAALAAIAVVLGQALSAGAAALCAGALAVPGLIFLNQSYRLFIRNIALGHVSSMVEREGGTDVGALANELGVPEADAKRILQKAIKEGYVNGEIDGQGRFVSADSVRCPNCGKRRPKTLKAEFCDGCGARIGTANP
jgi:hypothetical protein